MVSCGSGSATAPSSFPGRGDINHRSRAALSFAPRVLNTPPHNPAAENPAFVRANRVWRAGSVKAATAHSPSESGRVGVASLRPPCKRTKQRKEAERRKAQVHQ